MNAPMFVHSALDDAGLSPSEMRVLVRVARRWSEKHGCYESAPAMAEACCLNVKTVRAALKALVSRGILTARHRAGETTRYDWGTLPNERVGYSSGQGTETGSPLPKRVPGYPTQMDTPKGTPLTVLPKGEKREASVVSAPKKAEHANAPTLAEVNARASMAGVTTEAAEAFFYHYEAQNWTTGGQHPRPITNWVAKLMQWKTTQHRFDRPASPTAALTSGGSVPNLLDDDY